MARILITGNDLSGYGASQMACHYATALAEAGHAVKMLYAVPIAEEDKEETILPKLAEAGVLTEFVKDIPWGVFPFGCRALDRQAADRDIVLNTNLRDVAAAAAVANRKKIPSVIFLQAMPTFWGRGIPLRLKRSLYGQAVRDRATHVICVSDGIRERIIEDFEVSPAKVTTISNSLDLSEFPAATGNERESVRREFGIPDNELLLVNVARIDHLKGQDILIQAIHQLGKVKQKIRVLLVGDAGKGNNLLIEKYQRLAETLGVADRIVWAGFRKDVARLLYAADLSVLPSRSEGMPITALESFATKAPFLMSEYGKRFDDFEDGTHGWYVPKEDPESLARMISEIVQMSSEQRRKIGENGHDYFMRNLDLATGKRKFVEVVNSVLQKQGN